MRRARHAHQLGMRPVAHRRDDRLTDRELGDSLANLADDTRCLIPHHMRLGGEHAALPVQEVATLYADRGNVDQQPPAAHRGIGHVLVLEHLRPAGLVEDRGLHDVAPFVSDT